MNKNPINKIILVSALSILAGCVSNEPTTSAPTTPIKQPVAPSTTDIIEPCLTKCGDNEVEPGENNVIYDNHIFSTFAFNYVYNGNPGFVRVSSDLTPNPVPSTEAPYELIKEQYDFGKVKSKKLQATKTDSYRIESYFNKKSGLLTSFYIVNKKPISLISAAPVKTKNIINQKIESIIGIQGLYSGDMESYRKALPEMLKHFYKTITPPKK